jgi:hypothetical protein
MRVQVNKIVRSNSKLKRDFNLKNMHNLKHKKFNS